MAKDLVSRIRDRATHSVKRLAPTEAEVDAKVRALAGLKPPLASRDVQNSGIDTQRMYSIVKVATDIKPQKPLLPKD